MIPTRQISFECIADLRPVLQRPAQDHIKRAEEAPGSTRKHVFQCLHCRQLPRRRERHYPVVSSSKQRRSWHRISREQESTGGCAFQSSTRTVPLWQRHHFDRNRDVRDRHRTRSSMDTRHRRVEETRPILPGRRPSNHLLQPWAASFNHGGRRVARSCRWL